jgi:hypothetical protein
MQRLRHPAPTAGLARLPYGVGVGVVVAALCTGRLYSDFFFRPMDCIWSEWHLDKAQPNRVITKSRSRV